MVDHAPQLPATEPEPESMTIHSEPRRNDAALASFMRGKAEIDDLLARIQAASADHFGTEPEAVTWGHAGSLGFVTERLKEIAEFLRV
jgi:hypothetical protein